jgi:hypothetical protein
MLVFDITNRNCKEHYEVQVRNMRILMDEICEGTDLKKHVTFIERSFDAKSAGPSLT